MGEVIELRRRCPACSGKGRSNMELFPGLIAYGGPCAHCHGDGLVPAKLAAELERNQKAKSLPSNCLP